MWHNELVYSREDGKETVKRNLFHPVGGSIDADIF